MTIKKYSLYCAATIILTLQSGMTYYQLLLAYSLIVYHSLASLKPAADRWFDILAAMSCDFTSERGEYFLVVDPTGYAPVTLPCHGSVIATSPRIEWYPQRDSNSRRHKYY